MADALTRSLTTDSAAILRGRLFVLIAGAGMSLGGLFIRSIEGADEWQILFWRSLGVVAALLAYIAFRERGGTVTAFRKAGLKGIAAGLCLSIAFVGFVFSITHTTVANTLFMLSAAPFISAVLARLLLREEIRRGTLLAMFGAAAGVGIMVWEGAAAGEFFGNFVALAAAFGFAGFSIALRSGRNVGMMPAACLAGAFTAAGSLLVMIAAGYGVAISLADTGICLVYGVVAMGASLIVYTHGSKYVPAAELTLLSLSEVVLGPIWVWLAFAEAPSALTLLGGAILLLSIIGRAATGIRRRRPPVGIV